MLPLSGFWLHSNTVTSKAPEYISSPEHTKPTTTRGIILSEINQKLSVSYTLGEWENVHIEKDGKNWDMISPWTPTLGTVT